MIKTELLAPRPDAIEKAAGILRAGGLVAIPTETVYGLAANALDGAAVSAIFAAKGRPQDNPLISHIASMDMLGVVAGRVPPQAQRLAECFWPGPLTMVLPRGSAGSRRGVCGAGDCRRAHAQPPGGAGRDTRGRRPVGCAVSQPFRQPKPHHRAGRAGGYGRARAAYLRRRGL